MRVALSLKLRTARVLRLEPAHVIAGMGGKEP